MLMDCRLFDTLISDNYSFLPATIKSTGNSI